MGLCLIPAVVSCVVFRCHKETRLLMLSFLLFTKDNKQRHVTTRKNEAALSPVQNKQKTTESEASFVVLKRLVDEGLVWS